MTKVKKVRERSILKGALAGLVGGIAGAGAKVLAEKIYPPHTPGEPAPPVALVGQAVGHRLSEGHKQVAAQGIHWAFGALAGAVYGAAIEVTPAVGAWRGAGFGIALNKMTHESLLPKVGLAEAPMRQSTQERQSGWVTHVVYGVVTEAVRRIVRRGF